MGRTKVLIIDGIYEVPYIGLRHDTRYDVEYRETVSEGNKLLETEEPEVLVIGDGIVDGSGSSFCNHVTSHYGARVIASSREPSDELLFRAMGASEFLQKPFSFDQLKGTIERVLGGNQNE